MTTDNEPENLPQSALPHPSRLSEITAGAKVLPLVPTNFNEVVRYARMVMLAGAVPDALAKESGRQLPENEIVARVVTVIAAGSEVGMGPMTAMANIALINKRRLIYGQGAVAVLWASGQLEDFKVDKVGQLPGDSITTANFADTFGIRVTLKRKGQPTPFTGDFSVGQAKRAHLWLNVNKKPWIEHPEQMLFWRAFHIAATAGFSDCLAGLGIREVYEDAAPAPPQITDTSFLDAPARRENTGDEPGLRGASQRLTPRTDEEEVVPDTEQPNPDNAQAPVEPGPTPDDDIPPFPGDLPSAQPPVAPTEPPTPASRRPRRPRQPPGEELHFEPPPEPDEREDEDDREPPDPDIQ